MLVWRKGSDDVLDRRIEREGSLKEFLAPCADAGVRTTPTVGFYFHSMTSTTPYPLRVHGEINQAVPSDVTHVRLEYG